MSPVGPAHRPSPPPDAASGAAEAQWERARQAWALLVDERPEALGPARRKALFRALRVKRFEREALLARLPGAVRRGAQVDLLPIVETLREAGIDARLQRRLSHEAEERNDAR